MDRIDKSKLLEKLRKISKKEELKIDTLEVELKVYQNARGVHPEDGHEKGLKDSYKNHRGRWHMVNDIIKMIEKE